jgi:hypothetical protein
MAVLLLHREGLHRAGRGRRGQVLDLVLGFPEQLLVAAGPGSAGTGRARPPPMPSADVRSPNVWRRQAEMLGSVTPVIFSSNWITEV